MRVAVYAIKLMFLYSLKNEINIPCLKKDKQPAEMSMAFHGTSVQECEMIHTHE